MQRDEVVAVGDVAGEAIAGLTRHIHDVHDGIARRVWRSVGSVSDPVRLTHDRIADGVYRALTISLGGAVRISARAVSLRTAADAPSLEQSPAGRFAVGALNGAFGDALERRGNPLAWPMTLRAGGDEMPATPEALAAAYPRATGKLAVFLHGLCETEDAWRFGAARHVPYGERLRVERGYTPLYIRYNTGRHISQNGRELRALLEQVVAAWPGPVHEIALFGHSMGGLVARSACHYGADSGWAGKVRHVFTLGSPHRGAPLELAAYLACSAMRRLPETTAYAKALNRRSAGIKDLGRGYLVDEDWRDNDPQAFLTRSGQEIPFLPTANHYFVAATLTRDANSPLGRVMGDLLVLRASAWAHRGRGHRLRFPVEQYAHLSGANHFDLLNHPAIYNQIQHWLGARRALPAGPSVYTLLTAVALAAEHQLLGQRDPRRRRRVGEHRHGLGDTDRDGGLAPVSGDRHVLAVVADHLAVHSGFDPGVLEVMQEVLGLVLEPENRHACPRLAVGQRHAVDPFADSDRVTMGAGGSVSDCRADVRLETRCHCVLKLLCLLVHLVPGNADHIGEETFDHAVATDHTLGVLAPRLSEVDRASGIANDVAVALEPPDHLVDSRRRQMHRPGDVRRGHRQPCLEQPEQPLEVLLLGRSGVFGLHGGIVAGVA
jgi:hypothetical protein